MTQRIRIPKHEPKRRQKIDPIEFERLEDFQSGRVRGIESFPPEYRDYIQFMNNHPTRHPSYNPNMMDKQHLDEMRRQKRIGYSYNERDFDGDGKNDVLVWGKKGLKAFNGYSLKPAKWYPDRQFYYDNQDVEMPRGKGSKGQLNQMKQVYNRDTRGMPDANYNKYGEMENWDDYKGKRTAIYKETANDRGQTYNYNIKRKPKMRSLKSIFAEIAVDPTLKAIKDVQSGTNKFSFSLKDYNRIVKLLFNEFILQGTLDFEGFADEMAAYLEGTIDTENIEGRRLKAQMSKTLRESRKEIIDLIFANAETLQNRAYNQIIYSEAPTELIETPGFITAVMDKQTALARETRQRFGITE